MTKKMKVTPVCEMTDPYRPQAPSSAASLSTSTNSAYERSLIRIKQLEAELQQKDTVLDRLLKEQQQLRNSLQRCIQTLQKTTQLVNSADSGINNDYRQFLERIGDLEQENEVLKGANAAWSHRALTLEFNLLSVQAENAQMKAAQDLAVSVIARDETAKTLNIASHQSR